MGAGPNGEKLVVPTLRDFLIRQCAGISRHAKMLSQGLLSSSLLVKGVAEAALYCAHPSHQLPSPSEPRHAGFAHTGRRPLADIFHALNVDGLIENQRDASRRPMHHNRIKKHP